MTTTVFDVAVEGRVIESADCREDAELLRDAHPGSQIRTRAQSTAVPAAFAVFVNGVQVGSTISEPGEAAKTAKKLGGMIKMVAA